VPYASYHEQVDGYPNTSLSIWALFLWQTRAGQAPVNMFLVPDVWFSAEAIA
jgi:hypothetical protein